MERHRPSEPTLFKLSLNDVNFRMMKFESKQRDTGQWKTRSREAVSLPFNDRWHDAIADQPTIFWNRNEPLQYTAAHCFNRTDIALHVRHRRCDVRRSHDPGG